MLFNGISYISQHLLQAEMASDKPLPSGWEARYDEGQQRYFFIDHVHKITSWVDPRNSEPGRQISSKSEGSTNSAHSGPSGWQQQEQQKTELFTKMHSIFPTAPEWQIRNAITLEKNNETGIISRLEQNGFSRQGTSSQRQGSTNSAHSGTSGWQQQVQEKYGLTTKMIASDSEDSEDGEESSSEEEPIHKSKEQQKNDLFTKMRSMFPTAPEWMVRNAITAEKNDEVAIIRLLEQKGHHRQGTKAQEQENRVVGKLKKEFPTAEEDIVRDIVQALSGDEVKSRQELNRLGYDSAPKQGTTAKKNSRPSTSEQTTSKSGSKSNSSSPAPFKGTEKHQSLTESQKQKLVEQLHKEHSSFDNSSIRIALETCDFDVKQAKQLIQAMADRTKSTTKSSPPKETSSDHYVPMTTLQEPFNTSLTPVISSSSSTPVTMTPTRTQPTTTTSTRSHQQQHKSYLHQKDKPKTAVAVKNRAMVEPSTGYTSAYRSSAKGPNPDLHMGPNMDIIGDHYIKEQGHDPTLLQSLKHSLAVGPDPELHHGPDPSLVRGPDPGLAHGCAGQFGRESTVHHTSLHTEV